jgi:DNA-binding MarR family transcriptional regulator
MRGTRAGLAIQCARIEGIRIYLLRKNGVSDRISRYIAAVQPFAARVVLFHAAMAKKLRLNPTQFKCLRLVQIAGEAFATDLARECGLSLPAMTVILDRLESLGFVTRQRDPNDRRRYSVVAVPEQVKSVDVMYRKHSQKMASLLETYDDAAFEGLLQYLNDASALIGEEIARSAPAWL